MAHPIDLERAEEITQRTFRQGFFLAQALQAPEKLQDKATKAVVYEDDGHRPLAQLGQSVLETILLDRWLTVGHGRGDAHKLKSHYAGSEWLAQIARRTGLDVCVKRSQRQSASLPSPQTLKNVIAAIIGAVWLDSGRNYDDTYEVLETLGVMPKFDEIDAAGPLPA